MMKNLTDREAMVFHELEAHGMAPVFTVYAARCCAVGRVAYRRLERGNNPESM